jgi:hypothetical protein
MRERTTNTNLLMYGLKETDQNSSSKTKFTTTLKFTMVNWVVSGYSNLFQS